MKESNFDLAQTSPWNVTTRLHFRRTKIVATIGPASSSSQMLRQLIQSGLDVARINFSHGEASEHMKVIQRIRRESRKCGRIVTVLGDLCGPKIRVGQFPGGSVSLVDGSVVTITERKTAGSAQVLPIPCRGIVSRMKAGDKVLLDDGNLELRVLRRVAGGVAAEVIHGGVLKDRKGVNLPNTGLKIPALTAKDRKDALACIRGGVDYIALSFVRSASDIRDLKRLLKKRGSDIPVIAKIEKPEALDHMDEILSVADGIMVARGDLGVELPPEKVPMVQSRLIEKANQVNKPVIVATQMLESMIGNARPTRAEVTDVSMACMADADAVMLSGETAVGKFPIETLRMMDAILKETEAHQFFAYGGLFKDRTGFQRHEMLNAIGVAAAQISRDLKVRCISVLTRTGKTAIALSADRPAAPILAMTHSEAVRRRMNLLWGVYPFAVADKVSFRQFVRLSENEARGLKVAHGGQYMLLVSGLQGANNAVTNSITIHRLPEA